MEKVSVIDIQGEQWAIKDQAATDNINVLKEQLTPKRLGSIDIEFNIDYSAEYARIENVTQYGKIFCGNIAINNVRGKNIGTTETAMVAKVPFNPLDNINIICLDYRSGHTTRLGIEENGNFNILESQGVTSGDNLIRGQAIWVEE